MPQVNHPAALCRYSNFVWFHALQASTNGTSFTFCYAHDCYVSINFALTRENLQRKVERKAERKVEMTTEKTFQ